MANELFRVDGGYGFGSGNGNITSTDSLVINANTLSVSANIANLGNVGNISIGGGSNGQVLTTNGSGNLSWTTVSGGSGSSNTIYQTLANVPNANVVITAFAGNYDEGSGILNYYQASTYFIDESNVGSTAFYVDFRQSVTGGPYTSSVNSDAGYVYMYASNSKGIGEVSIGADNIINITGNVTFTSGNLSLGNISFVHINGGNSGEVLSTDGSGNLSWISAGGGGSSNTIYQTMANVPNANVVITAYASNYNDGNGILNYYQASTYFIDESNVGSTAFYVDFRQSVTGGPYTSSVNSDAGYVYMYASNSKGIGEVSIGADNIINITGNVTFTSGNLSLGNISFVHINGGNSGEVLSTDGSGNLSWISAGGAATSIDTGANGNFTITGTPFGNGAYANIANYDVTQWRTDTVNDSNGNPMLYYLMTVNGQIDVRTVANIPRSGRITADTVMVSSLLEVFDGRVDFQYTPNVTLGNVGNIHITGGNSGEVLSTDGAGNLSWVSAGGSTPTEILSTLDGGNAKVITSATLNDYGSGNVYTYSAAIYLNDSSGNYFSAPIAASIGQASNGGPFSTDVNIITGNLYIAATTSSGTGNIQFVSEDTITVGATNNFEFYTNVRVLNNKTVDFENASNITLGNVGNIHINGGSSGQVLSTDGAGNLSWITASGGGSPGGNTTEIQFNDSGSFAGSNELTFSTIPLPAVGTVVNAENISIKKGVFGVHITNSIGEVNGGGNVTPLAYDSGNNRKFGFFSYESPSSDLNMLPPTGNAQAYEIYNGETIKLRFTGNSAGNRNITWTTSGDYSYQEIGVTLPSVIVADKTTYVTCIFNDVTTRWDVVDVKAQT